MIYNTPDTVDILYLRGTIVSEVLPDSPIHPSGETWAALVHMPCSSGDVDKDLLLSAPFWASPDGIIVAKYLDGNNAAQVTISGGWEAGARLVFIAYISTTTISIGYIPSLNTPYAVFGQQVNITGNISL